MGEWRQRERITYCDMEYHKSQIGQSSGEVRVDIDIGCGKLY
jgi:hypothetical protein